MPVTDVTSGQTYATLSDAITGSSAGDVIDVPAGTYVENFPDISHSLTIQSSGGMAYLSNPQPDPPNTRAIINVPGNANVSLTLSGLDISGANNDITHPASIGGSNGAGILFESGNGALSVLNSHIHNNQDGILTGGTTSASTGGMTVSIVNSEIDHNGLPQSNPRYGFDHNLYIGDADQLTVTGSYIHDAAGGHEIKTRAHASSITGNRIFSLDGADSYAIDLADGGNNIVQNNVIEKGANSPQARFVDFGGEGTYLFSSLLLDSNSFINDDITGSLGGNAIALMNASFDYVFFAPDAADITNNLFYGPIDPYQDVYAPPYDTLANNQFLPLSAAPPLDTSPPFDVPAPGMGAVLLLAAVVTRLRRRGGCRTA